MVDTLHATPHLASVYQDPDPLPARLRAARLAHHLTRKVPGTAVFPPHLHPEEYLHYCVAGELCPQ